MIFIILLSSFVLATLPSESDIILYYYPNNISTLVIDDSNATTQYNATTYNSPIISQDGNNSAYIDCTRTSTQYLTSDNAINLGTGAFFSLFGQIGLQHLMRCM